MRDTKGCVEIKGSLFRIKKGLGFSKNPYGTPKDFATCHPCTKALSIEEVYLRDEAIMALGYSLLEVKIKRHLCSPFSQVFSLATLIKERKKILKFFLIVTDHFKGKY